MLAVLLLHTMSTKRRAAAKQRAAIEKCEEKVLKSVYCRTCLSTQNLVSIFYNSDTEEKMSRDLKLVTGLEIRINDELSQKICTECLKIFNLTLQFRRKSKHAEKTLLSMVSGDVIGPKRGSIELDVPMYPKITRTKMEVEDFDYDDNMSNGNDFQIDDDFDCKDDVKPIMMKHQTPLPTLQGRTARQKTMKIPNASSYKCNTCSKEFRMKATYKAHMRFHTNYCVCEACGKRCRNNNQLQEHKRARHGLGRIHKCAYCEYSSATKEALTIHERRHTGERPYICDHCGASFHRRANLVQHIAIHLPEKNFQCTYCPTREKSKKRLQIHISKNHRVKRYRYSFKCPCCCKLFQRNEHTHRHLSRVHHIPRADHPPIERVLLDGDKGSAPPPSGADRGRDHHGLVGNHFAPLLSNAM